MWETYLLISVICIPLSLIYNSIMKRTDFGKRRKTNLLRTMSFGAYFSSFFMLLPILWVTLGGDTVWDGIRVVLLTLQNAFQVLTSRCNYSVIRDGTKFCGEQLAVFYRLWASLLLFFAPVLSIGFVLSFFNDISERIRYAVTYFNNTYVFSELNEKSLTLAGDIKRKNKKAQIIFTGVIRKKGASNALCDKAVGMGAICFRRDLGAYCFKKNNAGSELSFFAMADDSSDNLKKALELIGKYRDRANTNVYVFASGVESELLLTSVDKGCVKVRRVNEVESLINRIFYDRAGFLFEDAVLQNDGTKHISAVIVGMGAHGTEMLKTLSWYGQMDGYSLEINAFDRDALAEEKFVATAPELISPDYNGVRVKGEAEYTITVHSGVDVATDLFAKRIFSLKNVTYVFVALGDDEVNINTAVNMRMYFERMGIHPRIQAVVYSTQKTNALRGIKNYRGQEYDVEFVGDRSSSYAYDVIINSELERDALMRHMKWGDEEEFWTYEYNYRSSIASALHMRARVACGISGADKKEDELTQAERDVIEVLEHRRWNAYMRSEGYVFSGSKDKSSRNDLAKMHHDLVDFSSLSEEEKRKDSAVGTN